jgi:hypothetical protein
VIAASVGGERVGWIYNPYFERAPRDVPVVKNTYAYLETAVILGNSGNWRKRMPILPLNTKRRNRSGLRGRYKVVIAMTHTLPNWVSARSVPSGPECRTTLL